MTEPGGGAYPEHSQVLTILRLGRWLHVRGLTTLARLVQLILRVIFSADIPVRMNIPVGVNFMHNGLGTVVHEDTQFCGPALVFHHVTLGNSVGATDGAPEIGAHVLIGTGASVLGGITVGEYGVVGAGAVLTRDLPPFHRATGNPAVIRPVAEEQLRAIWGNHSIRSSARSGG
ncbi:MAG TPA: hypothetical protein VI248_05245 [Kineosporiaceae bacterium]